MTGRLVALLVALALVGGCARESNRSASTTTSVDPDAAPAPEAARPGPRPCAAANGDDFNVGLIDYAFSPQCVRLTASQTMKVTNNGKVKHNASVEGKLDVDLEPSQSETVRDLSKQLAPGTYELFCKYHRANGMKAILQVVAS